MRTFFILILILAVSMTVMSSTPAGRRISPVQTQAAQTQAINETRNDTSRINAQRRARAGMHYVNKNGFTVYVDTVSGDEWIDSTARSRIPRMQYPLMDALAAGVNVWDPLMRAFGQKYGIADAWVELSLHNRYKPIVEVGLGTADYTPAGNNYTYRSPLSVYFRLGANYNFLYNSNPDYSFFAGLRYGLSPFRFSVDNVRPNNTYWGPAAPFDVPTQSVTAGWLEIVLGLRVKLWGPVSAGWTFRFKNTLHMSRTPYGEPWYIPGFGSKSTSVGGSFSITYTIPLRRANKDADGDVIDADNNDLQTSEQTSTPQ